MSTNDKLDQILNLMGHMQYNTNHKEDMIEIKSFMIQQSNKIDYLVTLINDLINKNSLSFSQGLLVANDLDQVNNRRRSKTQIPQQQVVQSQQQQIQQHHHNQQLRNQQVLDFSGLGNEISQNLLNQSLEQANNSDMSIIAQHAGQRTQSQQQQPSQPIGNETPPPGEQTQGSQSQGANSPDQEYAATLTFNGAPIPLPRIPRRLVLDSSLNQKLPPTKKPRVSYNFLNNPTSVKDIYEEYHSGYNGQTPLGQMDVKYGKAWRGNSRSKESKRFQRRKRVCDVIEYSVKKLGITVDRAIEMIEVFRGGKSLTWVMNGNFPNELLEDGKLAAL